jgi:hypothetical protein
LSLLDDLTAETIERMKAEGFEPAVVVETSLNNFQAWLNHGEILSAATSTAAAKQLAERFEGDPSSADWRHFGRLAGFTNPKPERQLASGLRPFARLRSAKGRVYSRAAEFLAGIVKTRRLQQYRNHARTSADAQKARGLSRSKTFTLIRLCRRSAPRGFSLGETRCRPSSDVRRDHRQAAQRPRSQQERQSQASARIRHEDGREGVAKPVKLDDPCL